MSPPVQRWPMNKAEAALSLRGSESLRNGAEKSDASDRSNQQSDVIAPAARSQERGPSSTKGAIRICTPERSKKKNGRHQPIIPWTAAG